MMAPNGNLVGIQKVKPVVQEFYKLCSGGMIALSSGILLFTVQSEKEPSHLQLLMLSMHALAIPLLTAGRLIGGLFDSFSAIPVRLSQKIERLNEAGVFLALIGYLLAIWGFSKLLFWVFFTGTMIAACFIRSMSEHMDHPHLVRRD